MTRLKGYRLFELALVQWIQRGTYSPVYIDWDRADELTIANSAFGSFDELVNCHRSYRPSIDVAVRDKLELANTYDAAQSRRGDPRRAFRYGLPARGITCQRWDSLIPQPTYDEHGRHAGMLMPRMRQDQIAATPGIQAWSAPTSETRTR